MLKAELLEIIKNGENSGVEFKRDDLRPEQLAKEIVAFANFEGGKVLLGVEDDGTITSIQRPDLESWVMNVFTDHIHPIIMPYYEEIALENNQRIAVITVLQGTSKPYVLRHHGREEIYIRIGSTSRLATREQQARLFASGGLLHPELLPVSGTHFENMDIARLKDYLANLVGDPEMPVSQNEWEIRLQGLGFMEQREDSPAVCTIAGLVLFGRAPRRYLRQAGIRWMAFSGNDKEYQALDDTFLDGPLVALCEGKANGGRQIIEPGLIERTLDRINPFISTESNSIDETMRRYRVWHYPLEVIREALLNALVHRDWTRALEVEIINYADRLEIISPGALQNSMTIDKMLAGQRSPRNPIIVEVMRDYSYIDARGMGVRRKIVPLMREQVGREPIFAATSDYLQITLPRATKS